VSLVHELEPVRISIVTGWRLQRLDVDLVLHARITNVTRRLSVDLARDVNPTRFCRDGVTSHMVITIKEL
jgi:hypothetical protein